jgi:Ca2+-transporting ATPase
VVATGSHSEIGHIGQSLSKLRSDTPRLQKETRRLTVVVGVLGAGISCLAVLLYGLWRGDWLNAALAGIALGMSMLPEEFPVVLTVFMAMGAWRISRIGVLTRRASAIESLGAATVLCTDKTGTLTENRMVIAELRLANGDRCDTTDPVNVASPWNELLRTGVLASAKEPFDPMEKAFHNLAASCDATAGSDWQIARTYGIRPDLLAVVQAWVVPEVSGATVAAKGAPEAIAALCQLGADELTRLHSAIDDMAGRGLRVLGLAEAQHSGADWPDTPRGFAFRFLGLVGLIDPLRQSVPEAVAQCRTAGIRIVMITGDHPQTAFAIAQAAGLVTSAVCTGADLQAMDDAGLRETAATCNVFARILPEQKLRIVQALKRNSEVVAMTGDGVNDAPSLKAADIGIAMGGRGTDVAREASAIVLRDDDFGSIVAAIRLGRRIYDNLRKAMGFILSVHIPIAGLALLPLVMGLPVLFWPVHIAFLEMIIDPVCSLVFEAEPEEATAMRRPPRRPDEQLFPLRLIVQSAGQGLLLFCLCAGLLLAANSLGLASEETRTVVFASLVGGLVCLALVNRSFDTSISASLAFSNRAFGVVLGLVALVLAAAILIPAVTRLFGFSSLGVGQMITVVGMWAATFALLHGLKRLAQIAARRPAHA